MEERLQAEFLRAQRYGQVLSVAFIDMDDFKGVNDTLGHDAGDAMLAFFAARLQKMARKIDSCARFAGDEFVVILPSTAAAQARAFMDRVEQFFHYSPVPGIDRLVRFSAGVASSADPRATSPALLLKCADEDLFARKAARPGLRRGRRA
jgi:diguanylate cyclase (GGDEF)-like protein